MQVLFEHEMKRVRENWPHIQSRITAYLDSQEDLPFDEVSAVLATMDSLDTDLEEEIVTFLMGFIAAHPLVSMNWLLFGKGFPDVALSQLAVTLADAFYELDEVKVALTKRDDLLQHYVLGDPGVMAMLCEEGVELLEGTLEPLS
ncbi:MAG TPA: hypothetical protein DCP28_35115 [Cytophagales bacterium]|nr:hypothetical protein [Cytophagales bacterium]